MRALALGLSLAVPSLAQTFVVDAANGPGTHFTAIATATAAVPDGAVLVVRAGVYEPFTIVGKGLKVLGEPGVTVAFTVLTPVRVANTAPHQGVVLRNLRLDSPGLSLSWAMPQLLLEHCQGSVQLDGIRVPDGRGVMMRTDDCDRVLARDCGLEAGASAGMFLVRQSSSHAVFATSELGTRPAFFVPIFGLPAVDAQGGSLQVADCTLRGGRIFNGLMPAVAMDGVELRLLGATLVQSQNSPSWPSPPLLGTGVVRAEPSVTFVGAPPLVPATYTLTTKVMPRAHAAYANGVASVELAGPSGALGALALALPGPRLALGFEDPLWLDLGTFGGLGAAVLGSSPWTVSLPLPPAALSGARVVFQGATFDQVSGLQLSNPSFVILP
jgi:hypothetical protein